MIFLRLRSFIIWVLDNGPQFWFTFSEIGPSSKLSFIDIIDIELWESGSVKSRGVGHFFTTLIEGLEGYFKMIVMWPPQYVAFEGVSEIM